MFQQIVDVDAFRVEQAAVEFRDADDLVARVGHQLGGVGANVAEALDDHPGRFAVHVQFFQGLVAHDHDAASGGLPASA